MAPPMPGMGAAAARGIIVFCLYASMAAAFPEAPELISCLRGRAPPVPPCGGGYPWTNQRWDFEGISYWQTLYEIPFMFDNVEDPVIRDNFMQATHMWTDWTCIRFREFDQDNMYFQDSPYVVVQVVDDPSICQSTCVGRPDFDPSLESQVCYAVLGWCTGANDVWAIARLIGVIMGLSYENKRWDALTEFRGHGPFLRVDWSVVPTKKRRLYEPRLWSYIGSSTYVGFATYDYRSLMHISPAGFEAFKMKPVFKALQNSAGDPIGEAKRPSNLDFKKINDIYSCRPGRILCSVLGSFCRQHGHERAKLEKLK